MVISCQHPVNAAADKVLGYTAAVSSRSWTTFLVADLIIGPTSRGQLPYWRCKIPSWQRGTGLLSFGDVPCNALVFFGHLQPCNLGIEHFHKDNLRHLPRFPDFFVTFRILSPVKTTLKGWRRRLDR